MLYLQLNSLYSKEEPFCACCCILNVETFSFFLQGLAILSCYGLSSDLGGRKEADTWRYVSYKMNFNGKKPMDEACIEIGTRR